MFIADLHIHSPWSRATSKKSDLPGLAAWAGVKGINLVATGDFTHPAWRAHLRENLVEAEPGLYRLKEDPAAPPLPGLPSKSAPVRFMLSAEISSIYKKNGRVRKIHNLVYVPSLDDADRISARLSAIGNIESDGRPILGLDARDLLEIVLEESEHGFLVPAHIWTPWFSLFGSKSGFDRLEDCFGDLSSHIFALETGLSSDPEMNRMVSALDRYTLISNSDCHSPSRLGREANLFSCALDFHAIRAALADPALGMAGTIEFFPEEGKYHLDGHRKCGVSLEPAETAELGGRCPVCGRPLTVGVLSRVFELADRKTPVWPEKAPAVHYLIPLAEVLGEILACGPATKKVTELYAKLVARFGSEFDVLLNADADGLGRTSPLLAEAVKRMREGRVIRRGGFDGEFGVIRVFEEGERERLAGQSFMFGITVPKKKKKRPRKPTPPVPPARETDAAPADASNPEQDEAIACPERRIMVVAGPGTGKTRTLTSRIISLVKERNAAPEGIWAITFTNRAADEMAERLAAAFAEREGGRDARGRPEPEKIFTGTFHAFCLFWLRKKFPDLEVAGEEDERGDSEEKTVTLDRVVPLFLETLAKDPDWAANVRSRVTHLLVDEFQDADPEQARLVEELGKSANVFVIGDADQAIYSFRGARVENFFAFQDVPGATVIRLKKNYRSRPEILAAAAALISGGRNSAGHIVPVRPAGGRVEYIPCPSPAAEAEAIVTRIEEIMGGVGSFSMYSGRADGDGTGCAFEDIAILCRLARQTGEIMKALRRRGLPVQLVGGTPFFARGRLKAAYGFLKWRVRPDDMDALAAAVMAIPGAGEKTVAEIVETGGRPKSQRGREAMARLRNLAATWEERMKTEPAAALADLLSLVDADPESEEGRRFTDLAASFSDQAALVGHLENLESRTIYDPKAKGIALMTMHAAKGLEFRAVFIPGLDAGIMPWAANPDREEERRLLYVAMTRASDHLFLLSGTGNESPLLAGIPEQLRPRTDAARPKKKKKEQRQLRLF